LKAGWASVAESGGLDLAAGRVVFQHGGRAAVDADG